MSEINSCDLEQQIISYCFLSADSLKTILSKVRIEDFENKKYQEIFQMVVEVWNKHGACNPLLILDKYGSLVVTNIMAAINKNVYFAEIDSTVELFVSKSRLQKLMKVCEQSIQAIKDGNRSGEAIMFYLKAAIHQLELQNVKVNAQTVTQGMEQLKIKIEQNKYDIQSGKQKARMLTGFSEIDSVLGGLLPTQMIVIAARPSVGKTTLALNIYSKLFLKGYNGAFISLEMSSEELCRKIASDIFDEPFEAIKNFQHTDGFESKLDHFLGTFFSSTIMDKGVSKIEDIELELKRRREQGFLDFAVIDYLQRIGLRNQSGNSYQDVTAVSMRIKELAIELDIPIIVLAQLSRKVEERADPTPFLSDLRDSGSIEADADVVMLLNRRDMKDPYDRPGMVDVNIAKNRAGRTKKIMLKAELEKSRMVDYNI